MNFIFKHPPRQLLQHLADGEVPEPAAAHPAVHPRDAGAEPRSAQPPGPEPAAVEPAGAQPVLRWGQDLLPPALESLFRTNTYYNLNEYLTISTKSLKVLT